ncbi:SCP domain-containing protein [Caenorhabditis elegans]|uniref:SCP domain-containing protein n=1 Tax=Caenorhabditis elegans TaxID=6239 RepID=Q19759_CAEEL|nr:SCP domain-containing protein [Caenorhabditis elegans]CAA94915.1 SCP domain-containing protein [Caenorhabditis elegans]|eukprot:NP_510403.1 Uncharacterized protein CELE_F23D12.3 [Caenorhabditis elegans]
MSALSNFSFRDNQAPPFDLEPIGLHLFQLVYKRVWSETLSFIHLKMMNKITVILVSLLILASGYKVRPSAKNAVQDAHDQLAKHIRCWEEVDDDDQSKGYTLSEPIYELCSFMPDPKDYNKFYVNGVDMESDVYTNFLAMYANALEGYAVLNVCIQEAFQFHAAKHPSQVSLRCLCKRDGCNLPMSFTNFLDYNKLALPEIHI